MADVSGDGHADLIVGATGESRVYVFDGRASGLIHTLSLPASAVCGSDRCRFGSAVAGGDLTGDGRAEVIVGAPHEDVDGNVSQGRAYVFNGDTGALIVTLNTPAPQPTATFGAAVAAGDVTGDGRADVIVGAPGQCLRTPILICAGQVFVLDGRSAALLHTLSSPSPSINGQFGISVAAGDVSGDSRAEVVVGAPGESAGGRAEQGGVHIFSVALFRPDPFAPPGVSVRSVTASGRPVCDRGAPGCWFGFDVALASVTRSGLMDIVIGAPLEDVDGVPDQGRAYVVNARGSLVTAYTLTTPNSESRSGCSTQCNRFGVAVAGGDVNGDGWADIIVGANAESLVPGGVGPDPFGPPLKQGRTYVFSGRDGTLLQTIDSPSPEEINEVLFGTALAAADVDGDGAADILVGAFRDDVDGVFEQGRAYLFHGARRETTDFETPSLGDSARRIVNPYTAAGVTFTADQMTLGDEVVGLVKNSATSACVEPANTDQKLGTGRSSLSTDGRIGLSGFPIRATFSRPLAAGPRPVTVSVTFQALAETSLRLRLFDPSGTEVASMIKAAAPAAGDCGLPGGPRAATVVTATSARPVAYAVMDTVEGDRVFVIDSFTWTP
jgi:hypothetical protein